MNIECLRKPKGYILLVCIGIIQHHSLYPLLPAVIDRANKMTTEVIISKNDHVSCELYVLATWDVLGIDTHEYVSMSVKWVIHSTAALFLSILGWYDSSKTIIIITFLIYDEIYSLSDIPSVFSHIHVYTQYLHMYYSNLGIILYVSIIPSDPCYLT